MDIGNSIKEYRKKRNLTLQQLADLTGLSTGYLSNLERNVSSPTLINLQRICEKLKINLQDLIEKSPKENPVVKKSDRRAIFSPNKMVTYEATTEIQNSMTGVCMTIAEGLFDKELISWGHHSDELGVIIKGSISMTIADQEYILEEGDTIFIKAHSPHRYKKIGTEKCVSYWTFNSPGENEETMNDSMQ